MRLTEDLSAYLDWARKGGEATLFDLSILYLVLFRLGSGLYQLIRTVFFPVRILKKLLELIFGVYIPFGVDIGGGLFINYYHGLIVNGRTRMGKNCRIYARVCIGNRFPGNAVVTPCTLGNYLKKSPA